MRRPAARTDTDWCQGLLREFPVCFVDGRIRFVGNGGPAPFPSMLVWISERPADVFAATCADVGVSMLSMA